MHNPYLACSHIRTGRDRTQTVPSNFVTCDDGAKPFDFLKRSVELEPGEQAQFLKQNRIITPHHHLLHQTSYLVECCYTRFIF